MKSFLLGLLALLALAAPVEAQQLSNGGKFTAAPVAATVDTWMPVRTDAYGNVYTVAGSSTGGATGGVNAVNSSSVALGGSGVFTGTGVDVTGMTSIVVSVFSNVASATDGLSMQQSVDGTNWDIIDAYSIPAATGKTFAVQVAEKFFRVVYTNGAGAQATFRLSTILRPAGGVSSSVRPQDARTNDNDMIEMLGYNMVFNGTTWDRLRSDPANFGVVTSAIPKAVTGNVTSSAIGTTAATVATLAAAASKTTYLCGFTITADATAALAAAATVTGTVSGSLNYLQGVGIAPAVVQLSQNFNPCIPGSAVNTAIVVTSAAAGTGGNTAVAAWGFQQ